MIIKTFIVGPLGNNTYVLADERSGFAALIDPGLGSEQILQALERSRFKVVSIINTHGHFDHIAGNAFFKAKTGAELLLHEDDLPLLPHQRKVAGFFGFTVPSSPLPDRFLKDGDEIRIGTLVMKVHHTPGHSPGGICLQGDGVLFSGDILFAGSIGRTDLPGGSYEAIMASIEGRILTLSDETLVYPGHGPVTTIGEERRSNPFLAGG